MGNYFSNFITEINVINEELEIDKIINDIINNEKFIEYQDKFNKLKMSTDIYIDGNELIIEVIGKTSYSIQQYTYNWLNPGDIDKMYKKLDDLFVHRN